MEEGYRLSKFNWSTASAVLQKFGGDSVTLFVEKTGLPFYDALRLYGAIDLYIGLREDVTITDMGIRWKISGRSRPNFMNGRDVKFLEEIKKQNGKKSIKSSDYCREIYSALVNGESFNDKYSVEAKKALVGLDSVLQDGIRGISAYSYETLQTGQTSKKECKAMIPLSDGLLAFAGKKRTENLSNIYFLPVFEGNIDLSKVVSPLRAWIGSPNVLCTQALMLLMLKTSLFAEGYQDRLKSVVYDTDIDSRKGFNFSGIIEIQSTAIGRIKSSDLTNQLYYTFRTLVTKAWDRQKTNDMTFDALSMAYWLMQPVRAHLSSMITSQERLRRGKKEGDNYIVQPTLFDAPNKNYAKEVFEMTYENWKGDHEAVRKLARAVASGIQWSRGRDERGIFLDSKEQRKRWYDEVVMLRSAPSAKTFLERVMILIEQGHREHGQIATVHREEDFDPKALFESIGSNRSEFETFRDLFRMYLVQESRYKSADESIKATDVNIDEPNSGD